MGMPWAPQSANISNLEVEQGKARNWGKQGKMKEAGPLKPQSSWQNRVGGNERGRPFEAAEYGSWGKKEIGSRSEF